MIPLPDSVAARVSEIAGEVRRAEPVGGGCIAHATCVETEQGRFFLKWSAGEAGRTFEAEAAGLHALRIAASPLGVPEVLAVENADRLQPGFLLMAWIEPGPKPGDFWQAFGEGLAALHGHTAPDGSYGLETDNFIGHIKQLNHSESALSWPAFFRSNRLGFQIGWAREMGNWHPAWNQSADRLLDRLDTLLPTAPRASMLHGDLWSGNFIPTAQGRAALIDPAVYYGHCETDLALTELFGGFGAPFYDAYRAAWPLEPGYAERREVYNLYHLLNHLNHFGASYAPQVERTLKRFG